MELVTVRDGRKLVPATAFDLQELEKVGNGVPLATTLVHTRSVKHNRWYRALVGVVADGIGMHPATLHAEIKFLAGFVRRILMVKEGVTVELDSVAFATMDQAKFKEFTDLAIEIIFSRFLPKVRRKDVYARVHAMVGPRPR